MDPLHELHELAGWDAGRQLALLKKLGGRANAEAVLREELEVVLQQKTLFDTHGRRIPAGLSALVCDPNPEVNLVQPNILVTEDNANRIARLHNYLGVHLYTGITEQSFQNEIIRLLKLVQKNPRTANIVKGVCLPVICPSMIYHDLPSHDLGTDVEYYLYCAEKSYTQMYPDLVPYNYNRGTLHNRVEIVAGSRHEVLVARMNRGPVIGLYFPQALQGFSVDASREQMENLPDGFILSGLDVVIGMIMYPDVLARPQCMLCLTLAALSFQAFQGDSSSLQSSRAASLYFKSFTTGLVFDRGINTEVALGNFSSGLLFIDT